MLVLYKLYKFKFSDLVYRDPNIYVGRYSNSHFGIQVETQSTSPKLYNLYFVNTTRYNNTTEARYEKTEAEIEVILNQAIRIFRHVNTI